MGLQTIVDNATFLTINKRKGTGQTISRSGHIKTSIEQPSLYRFSVGMHAGLTYSTNRDLLEDLDTLDRTIESNISLNNNTNMNYLTNHLGGITGGTFSVNGSDGAEIYLDCSSVTGSNYLFRKGDFLQPQGNTGTYRYPYQVTNDVFFSTGANVTVPLHRNVLSQDGVTIVGSDLRIGNEVRFHLKALDMPTYNVVPHDRIEFTGTFELIEVIT